MTSASVVNTERGGIRSIVNQRLPCFRLFSLLRRRHRIPSKSMLPNNILWIWPTVLNYRHNLSLLPAAASAVPAGVLPVIIASSSRGGRTASQVLAALDAYTHSSLIEFALLWIRLLWLQTSLWGDVEWHHGIDKLESNSRLAAATLFVHLNCGDLSTAFNKSANARPI